MAWKSSQPRRSAALKSDRLSFRTTVSVRSPNACRKFSKYWVTMPTPPSLVVARAECGKPGSVNFAGRNLLRPDLGLYHRGHGHASTHGGVNCAFAKDSLLHCIAIDACQSPLTSTLIY